MITLKNIGLGVFFAGLTFVIISVLKEIFTDILVNQSIPILVKIGLFALFIGIVIIFYYIIMDRVKDSKKERLEINQKQNDNNNNRKNS